METIDATKRKIDQLIDSYIRRETIWVESRIHPQYNAEMRWRIGNLDSLKKELYKLISTENKKDV